MRRREFIAVLGGAVALPMVASAQEPKPLVFYLIFGAAADTVASSLGA